MFVNEFSLGSTHNGDEFIRLCFFDLLYRAEMPEQRFCRGFSNTFDIAESGFDDALAAFVPVVCDTESMHFIPQLLDDAKGLTFFIKI